jgi:hypothetical protein
VGYSATATVQTPDLVAVSPGVSVIADYDEPIFYSDGFYWWNYGGGWYRSSYYTGGWVEARPPVAVVRVGGNTSYYRHYRPRGYVAKYRPQPSHRIQRPHLRDRRARR